MTSQSTFSAMARLRMLHMVWEDLAFLHWPIEGSLLSERLPDRVMLDTYAGQAWLGITPFRMTQVRPAWVPPVPGISTFPELNVRTYVIADGIPGIWFFSLDAAQWLAVLGARQVLRLPYCHARARIETTLESVRWKSERTGADRPGRFAATYRPVGEVYTASPGKLDHWFAERYCLYNVGWSGAAYRLAIHHRPWPLQAAEADITANTMFKANGFPPPTERPLAHFARRLEVWACVPERLS